MKIKEILSKEDLRSLGIGAYSRVAELEYKEGAIVYVASTPYGGSFNGFQKNTTRAYVCKDGSVSLLFSDLRRHRAQQAIKAWEAGDVGTVIPYYVWENYITNGYNTRRGLYADYSSKEERINRIARSHADYLGCETGDSSTDHKNRVALRNGSSKD